VEETLHCIRVVRDLDRDVDNCRAAGFAHDPFVGIVVEKKDRGRRRRPSRSRASRAIQDLLLRRTTSRTAGALSTMIATS
jgi:hypothetical protein